MATRRGRQIASMNRKMERINDAGSEMAKRICELIVDEIRTNPDTPHLTGELRSSYRVQQVPDGSGDWEVVTDRRYWRFVEFGTKEHGDAQPHVRPAIEYVRGVFR